MTRRKILYLTLEPSPYRRLFFVELANYCDVTVIYEKYRSKDREWFVETRKVNGLNEVFLETNNNRFFQFSIVKKYLKKEFDVVIVGGYSTTFGLFSCFWLKLHHKPFMLNADGGIIKEENRIKFLLKKSAISTATWWLSSGKKTSEYFLHYGATKDNIYEFPFSSVKEDEILNNVLTRKEKRIIKKELEIENEFVILFIGQFIYRKGIDVLLKACGNLENVGVYIIGGKPTKEYLDLVDEYSLNSIHFIEFLQRDSIDKYYRAADLFVLPTREDIWGLVINEALSYALPVITTNKCVAGIELINNINGRIVDSDNSVQLREAMDFFCDTYKHQYDRYIQFCENALNTAKKYTIEKMAKSHAEIIESVL